MSSASRTQICLPQAPVPLSRPLPSRKTRNFLPVGSEQSLWASSCSSREGARPRLTTGHCQRGVLLGGCASHLAARGRAASITAHGQASSRVPLYGRLGEMTLRSLKRGWDRSVDIACEGSGHTDLIASAILQTTGQPVAEPGCPPGQSPGQLPRPPDKDLSVMYTETFP